MRLLSEAAYVLRTRLESSLQSSHRDRPLLAIGLVLASTVFLSCSDVTAKYLASSVPAIEIAWLRYLVFLLIVLPPVLRTGVKRTFRSQRPGLQVFRGLALVTSSILFISSLRYLPIAEATATSFAAPIFITALSVVVLGEKVGYRRWAATFAGLIGVLVVVRTGTSAFDPASILPLMAALSWASAVVVTRQTSAVDSALSTLAYSAVIGVLVLSALLPFFWMPPDWSTILFGTLIGCADGRTLSHHGRISIRRCLRARTIHLYAACMGHWPRHPALRGHPGSVARRRSDGDRRERPLHRA